jgi:hypothetical protein
MVRSTAKAAQHMAVAVAAVRLDFDAQPVEAAIKVAAVGVLAGLAVTAGFAIGSSKR